MGEGNMVISRAELAELATLKSKTLIVAVVNSVNLAACGMSHEEVMKHFRKAVKVTTVAHGGIVDIPDEEKAKNLLRHFLSVLPSRLSE